MVPLPIATKLQNMNKFLGGPILHLVIGFADFNSPALSLQAGNHLQTNKTAIKKKRPTDNTEFLNRCLRKTLQI